MYRILVIDDEPSICKALTMGLTSTDMEVYSTGTGGTGVRRGCAEEFDVFIVDLYLPDMNGLDVIREMKKCTPESVYILITAQNQPDNSADAEKIGIDGFLEKPLDMKSVQDAIKSGLDHREDRFDSA